jgi:hypothetical protein
MHSPGSSRPRCNSIIFHHELPPHLARRPEPPVRATRSRCWALPGLLKPPPPQAGPRVALAPRRGHSVRWYWWCPALSMCGRWATGPFLGCWAVSRPEGGHKGPAFGHWLFLLPLPPSVWTSEQHRRRGCCHLPKLRKITGEEGELVAQSQL